MTLHQVCCVLPSEQLSLNQSQHVKMSCFVFVANPCWYKSYIQRRGTQENEILLVAAAEKGMHTADYLFVRATRLHHT